MGKLQSNDHRFDPYPTLRFTSGRELRGKQPKRQWNASEGELLPTEGSVVPVYASPH